MSTKPRIVHLILVGIMFALVVILAGGCQTWREDWSHVRPRPMPEVQQMSQALTVGFAADDSRLTDAQRDQLDAFLAGFADDPSAETFVVPGPGTDSLSERRRQTVAAFLRLRGLSPKTVAGAGGFATPDDTVAVVVRRYAVNLPPCPDWTAQPGRLWHNTVDSNWGCATATNLGLMLARPGDLTRGRSPGPMDGEYAVLGIQRYRAGETAPLTPEDVGTIESQQKTSSGSSGGGED